MSLMLFAALGFAQTPQLDRAKKLIYTNPDEARSLVQPYLKEHNYLAAKAGSIVAKSYEKQGLNVTAYQAYSSALNELFAADTLDHYLEYAIYNNMAMLASESNQYEIAAGLYHKAADAANRYVKYEPEVAEKFNELLLPNKVKFYEGNALYDAGKVEEAAALYIQLDNEIKGSDEGEIEDLNTFALLRNEYGLNAKATKDYANAAFYFRSIAEMAGVHGYYKQSAYHNLALVNKEQGEYDLALSNFDKAIEIKGAVAEQYFVSMMDKGELLIDLGRNSDAAKVLQQATELKVDVSHDLRLLNVYYLLERANKDIDLQVSNEYGDKYQQLIKDHIARQSQIIAQEKARVFAMALNEEKHRLQLEEYERQYRAEMVMRAVRIFLIVTGAILLVVLCLRFRAKSAIQKI